MNGRERVLGVIEGRPVDCLPQLPIVMMFAADLIGKPYGKYATDFRVLAEGQLRTAERFEFDYVSCISDPAREAADCGAVVEYYDDQPPAIKESQALLAEKSTLAALKAPDPFAAGRMNDRVKAAALLREKVGDDLAVEGWIEGPCAEAADLRGINRLMLDFYDDPGFVRDLFEFVLEMETRFAKAQIEAGVDWLGMGDAAASLVGPKLYEDLVLPYEQRLVDAVHAMGGRVRLHICGNTRRILRGMASLGCAVFDLDSMVPMDQARAEMGPGAVLAGNIDPVKVLRNGSPAEIHRALAECHRQSGPRYIVGAGCEVPRDTPHENLMAMRDYARGHCPVASAGDGEE